MVLYQPLKFKTGQSLMREAKRDDPDIFLFLHLHTFDTPLAKQFFRRSHRSYSADNKLQRNAIIF